MKHQTWMMALVVVGLFLSSPLHAGVDGEWIGGDGNWSDSTKWKDGVIADGADATALFDFSPQNLIYPELDLSMTIGHFDFSESRGRLSPSGWRLLTLETQSGTPTVTNDAGIDLWVRLGGAQGFEKWGRGTLGLTASSTYTGVTHVRKGILEVYNYDDALGASGAGNHTVVYSGAQLRLDPDITLAETLQLSGVGTAAASGALQLMEDVTCSGPISLNADSTIRLEEYYDPGTATISGDIALANHALTLESAGSGMVLVISGAINGTGALEKIGSGRVTLSATNTYEGGTTISNGTLRVSSDANLGKAGAGVTFDGGTLELTGTSFSTTGRTFLLNSTVGTISIAEAAATLTYGQSLTGTGDLTKQGAGRLSLTGSNGSYTGDIIVAQGTLGAGIGNSLGADTRVTVQSGAKLVMEGSEDFGSLSGAGAVQLGTHSIRVGLDDTTTVHSGVLSGSGLFRKAGGGTMTFSGNLTHTGGMEIQAGALVLSGSNNSMSGTILVLDGATLRAGLNDSLGVATIVDVATGGSFVLEDDEEFGGLTGGGSVDTAGFRLAPGEDNTTRVFLGVISGSGSVDKLGTGTWTLTGDQAYTGATTVSAGTLRLTGNNSAGSTNIIVRDGATLQAGEKDSLGNTTRVDVQAGGTFTLDSGEAFGSLHGAGAVDLTNGGIDIGGTGESMLFSGSLSGGGGVLKGGTGTLTFTGDNSAHTGNTTVTRGTLAVTAGTYKTGQLVVATDGIAAMTISGGTVQATGTMRIGQDSTARGTMSISDTGTLECSTYLVVGYDGTGELIQDAGSVTVLNDSPLYIGERAGSDGTYSLNGGSLHVTGDLVIGGNTGGSGGTGLLTVAEGASLTVDGELKLWAGGTLDGDGTITANLVNAGTLAPGNSPGVMTVLGNYTQDAAAMLELELGGTTRGAEYDALDITGEATLGGTLEVLWFAGFEAADGDTFNLLDWGTLAAGTEFDSLILPTFTEAGLDWDTSVLYTDGTISAVPEPATMSLLALGGVAMLKRRRGKK